MTDNNFFIDKIREFMYSPDFDIQNPGGSKLISSSYLKNIISSIYSDNSNIPQYSIIAGDFDKLQGLNSKYGIEEVNHCMEKCLNIISQILPNDALPIRYAGDEFLFILPSVTSKEDANQYIDKINKSIDNQKSSFHGLTITLASALSKEYSSLLQMYNHADKKIYNQKKKDSATISLHDAFYASLSEFFSSFRFSNDYKMTDEQLHTIIRDAWVASSNIITNYKKNTGSYLGRKANSSSITFPSSVFSPEKATAMNDILMKNNDLTSSKLLTNSDWQTLSKSLVFDEHSKAFSKEYFNKYLINSLPEQDYNLYLMQLSGLKISNLLNGHVPTDNIMYDMYNEINSSLDGDMFFKDNPFKVNPTDCFKIALGGGNLLFVTPQGVEVPIDKIANAANNSNDLLHYIYSRSQAPIKPNDMQKWIEENKNSSYRLKDKYKSTLFDNNLIYSVLSSCLYDNIKDYCENNSDYMDTDQLKNLLTVLSTAIKDASKGYRSSPGKNDTSNIHNHDKRNKEADELDL